MSNQTEQQRENTIKPKIMTGYIYHNQDEDLTSLFDTLNDFRKNCGLKYSHQKGLGLVFFNISSEHLDAFSKVRPFKISKFHMKSGKKKSTWNRLQLDDARVAAMFDNNDVLLRRRA